jgi:hypothetical protein
MTHPTILVLLHAYLLLQDRGFQTGNSNDGGIHIQTYRESRLAAEELFEAVFSLQSDPELCREDNHLLRTMFAVICSAQNSESWKI